MSFVKQYGPIYLTPEEYDKRLAEVTNTYYRMLGNSLIKAREKSFWDCHKKALYDLGYSLSWRRTLKGALWEVGDILKEPLRALLRQIQFIRHKGKVKTHSNEHLSPGGVSSVRRYNP